MTAKTERIPGYCALCWSSCGCISVVEDGRLVAIEADPEHPTGAALCAKGRAAPEHVYSDARELYPLKRTNPKGAKDPGWERISWDEALDITAGRIKAIEEKSGKASVAFSITTSAGTAMQDGYPFVERLRQAYGTPNAVASIELCNFANAFVFGYTYGVPMPPSEVENGDCIILWAHNPNTTWLAFATRINKAKRRGAKLIVVDPLRVGLAAKADEWLRVRPGSDGALALAMANVIIEEQLFDFDFVRDWTNAPLLVRNDNGALLTAADIDPNGDATTKVAWDDGANGALLYDPTQGNYENEGKPALRGAYEINGIRCRTAFENYARLCSETPPERAAEICWLDADQIRKTARLIGNSKAVSCYHWAGLEMHSNTSQSSRAIDCLYALTGCFDAPGGNVILENVPVNDVFGRELMPEEMLDKSVGQEERSLGPESIFNWITTDALYKAVLDREPYGVNALVSFGMNVLLSHADGERGARALDALDFMVHIDPFMTPTAQHADIFLPVNSPWEREGLKTNFVVDQKACDRVQLRQQVIEERGESRSDTWIAFALAKRLGLSEHFWEGNVDAAYEEILDGSGVGLAELREQPTGIDKEQQTRYRKYQETGFATPSGKVEIYSQTFFDNGYPAMPEYHEPGMGPHSQPGLAKEYPLVLTDTKTPHFIHSQYRHVPKLRRSERQPRIDVHPETASARGIKEGDWVELATPHGKARMTARFVEAIHPGVIRATAGWWQNCEGLGLDGYDPENDEGANYNRIIGNDIYDPVGGCVPHKSYLCEIKKAPS
ncbi:MAG: molybdopterin-dependent oxidoreductase [Pseudomonadota bacterium]